MGHDVSVIVRMAKSAARNVHLALLARPVVQGSEEGRADLDVLARPGATASGSTANGVAVRSVQAGVAGIESSLNIEHVSLGILGDPAKVALVVIQKLLGIHFYFFPGSRFHR